MLVGRSSYKNYPSHHNKNDLARLFGDRFNFEMAILNPLKYPRGPKLSYFAFETITYADEWRLRDAELAVDLLRDLYSQSPKQSYAETYETTLRQHKYGSDDLADKYLTDVKNLENFKRATQNPALEGSQEMVDAYMATLSDRGMSSSEMNHIWNTAKTASKGLVSGSKGDSPPRRTGLHTGERGSGTTLHRKCPW